MPDDSNPRGCPVWVENFIMDTLTQRRRDGEDDTSIKAQWFKLLASGQWTQGDKITAYARSITDEALKRDSAVHFRKGCGHVL